MGLSQLCQINYHSLVCFPTSKIMVLFAFLPFFVRKGFCTKTSFIVVMGFWRRMKVNAYVQSACYSGHPAVGPFSCRCTLVAFPLHSYQRGYLPSALSMFRTAVVGVPRCGMVRAHASAASQTMAFPQMLVGRSASPSDGGEVLSPHSP